MMKNQNEKTVKEVLIETALELFYEKGYFATGINEIIKKAGVSKGTFYHYFPSKEALCLAYLQQRHQLWSDWLEKEIRKFKDPFDRYLAPFGFLNRWMRECGFRGCAFLNIASEIPDLSSELRQEVIHSKKALIERIEKLVEELLSSDSKYHSLSAKEISLEYYVLFDGAIITSRNFGETWPIMAAQTAAKKLLCSF